MDLRAKVIIEKAERTLEIFREPMYNGTLSVKVTEKDIVISDQQYPFDSYCYQFISALYSTLSGDPSIIRDTNGDLGYYTFDKEDMSIAKYSITSPYDYDARGIVVGSDDGTGEPHAITNYRLGTLVQNGATSGKLTYDKYTTRKLVSQEGDNIVLELSRRFLNESGGAIDIKEIGIYATLIYQACIVRDILPSTITLSPGQTLTVTYKILMSEVLGFTKNLVTVLSATSCEYFLDESSEYLKFLDGTTEVIHTINVVGNPKINYTNYPKLWASYGDDGYGMQIGNGNSTESGDSYCLDSQIMQGAVEYHRHHFTGVVVGATTATCEFSRLFSNHTTEDITFSEVALVGYGKGTTKGLMLFRSVITPVTIHPEETVKIRIQFEGSI
ncbi:MAG TPA: hypothetical protein PKN48_00660 [Bacteroidales bacterium]|nr:hypothetical protein [Bacteroidales bacterium]